MTLAWNYLKPHKSLVGPNLNKDACPNFTLFKHGTKAALVLIGFFSVTVLMTFCIKISKWMNAQICLKASDKRKKERKRE